MATYRWSSLQELIAVQEKMNRLFEETLYRREFAPGAPAEPEARWTPAADAYEASERYVFRVEIPGVSLSEVKLEIDDRRLRVSGTRPEVDTAKRFLRMERVYGEFSRDFEIPADLDAGGIEASLESGILTITAPKRRIGVSPERK